MSVWHLLNDIKEMTTGASKLFLVTIYRRTRRLYSKLYKTFFYKYIWLLTLFQRNFLIMSCLFILASLENY